MARLSGPALSTLWMLMPRLQAVQASTILLWPCSSMRGEAWATSPSRGMEDWGWGGTTDLSKLASLNPRSNMYSDTRASRPEAAARPLSSSCGKSIPMACLIQLMASIMVEPMRGMTCAQRLGRDLGSGWGLLRLGIMTSMKCCLWPRSDCSFHNHQMHLVQSQNPLIKSLVTNYDIKTSTLKPDPRVGTGFDKKMSSSPK